VKSCTGGVILIPQSQENNLSLAREAETTETLRYAQGDKFEVPATWCNVELLRLRSVRQIRFTFVPHPTLTNSEMRKLKAEAQRLDPVVYVGKSGLTAAVLKSIDVALRARELIKIRFDHDRDERDVLAGKIVEATGAALIMQVGKVAVYYRPKPPASND
jgi:RNA-binding protein